jgi:NAD(P)-dependent dehydrogenase (short-subunit alcohol dehydrogenase family)
VTAVNLDGTFVTLRDLARHMIATGTAGKLVAVSSMVEHFGSPTQPHYAASKGGVGAAYLASDEAAFHTGVSIRIDGGYSIF